MLLLCCVSCVIPGLGDRLELQGTVGTRRYDRPKHPGAAARADERRAGGRRPIPHSAARARVAVVTSVVHSQYERQDGGDSVRAGGRNSC
jgi:hypothetical protein